MGGKENNKGLINQQMNAPISSNNKIIPLKQLKDVINEICVQKVKFDNKNKENKLPLETMEQYMYTYLVQKYGLKSLIIDWATLIINGVRTYINDDHEIALFAKILKNECDEEFRFIQLHVKDTLANILKQVLREKYPLKSEAELAKMTDKIQDGGRLEDWQWKKIVAKMYDQYDQATLIAQIHEKIRDRRAMKEGEITPQYFSATNNFSNKQRSMSRRLSREQEVARKKMIKTESKLFYAELLKIILDFQL